MLSLQSHHIVELFVWIDGLLPDERRPKGGRPQLLSDSEIVTILVWNVLVIKQKNLKDIHRFARLHLHNEFPSLPKYNGFLEHCHRVTPRMFAILDFLLQKESSVIFMDSTMLEVCTTKRAEGHKVAKGLAQFGKNHQGWHFGFKLHAAISEKKCLTAFTFTPANIHDAQQMPELVNEKTKVGIGDSHYGASVMGRILWKRYGTVFIAPPHYKQKKKIATLIQNKLLSDRSKIESVFDVLKQHLHLVSSFPRSVFGYAVHCVRILLGYQVMALMSGA